jgi:hypothetical protein
VFDILQQINQNDGYNIYVIERIIHKEMLNLLESIRAPCQMNEC